MADTVAYLLEQTVEECEEWERSGTFTRAEIKRIVAARTRHEYALKRRAVLKADFLRAIQARQPRPRRDSRGRDSRRPPPPPP